MKHIVITLVAEGNQTIAFGYNPKYYEDESHQYEDILRDMEHFKAAHEGEELFISVASISEDKEESNSTIYVTIDKLLEEFKPTTEETGDSSNQDITEEIPE